MAACAQHAIPVERDTEGLQMALRELFEEGYQRNLLEVCEGDEEGAAADLEAEMPERTLSPGYYQRAGYLLNVSRAMELGVTYSAASLTHAEVEGLYAVRCARNEFEYDHPECGRCGARQWDRFVTTCHKCGYNRAKREN
jgi:ribosomal protein L37E